MSCVQERAPRLIQGASKICGASSGCLVAVALTVGIPVGESGSELLKTRRYFLKKNSTPEDICSFVSSVCKSCDCFVHCYNTLYANIGVFFFSCLCCGAFPVAIVVISYEKSMICYLRSDDDWCKPSCCQVHTYSCISGVRVQVSQRSKSRAANKEEKNTSISPSELLRHTDATITILRFVLCWIYNNEAMS